MSHAFGALRHVAVGSSNPVKVQAVRAVFRTIAPEAVVSGIEVSSGVASHVDRQRAYEVIIAYALAPFVSREMW